MKEGFISKIYAGILAVSSLILVIAIQATLLVMFGDTDSPLKKGLFYLVYSVFSILIFGLIYRYMQNNLYNRFEPRENLCEKMSVFSIILVAFGIQSFGYGALNLIYLAASNTELFKEYVKIMDGITGSGTTPLITFYTILLAPVCEELIFRGAVMNGLRYGFSDKTSNVLAALLFGIFHGNIIQGIYAFVFGMVLGYVKLKRDRIGDAVLMHIFINLTGITIVPILATLINVITNPVIAYMTVGIIGAVICIIWIAREKINKLDLIQ